MLDAIQFLDGAVMLWIQDNLRCGVLDAVLSIFTYLGDSGLVWLLLAAGLLLTREHRRSGLCLLLCVALCFCLNDLVIKPIAARPRPFLDVPGLTTVVPPPGSWSFPSGHACSSFAAAYALTWRFGRKGAWFYILAVLIAVSRPYVGVHYVSDILAGAVVGTVGSTVICFVFRKVENRIVTGKRRI